MFKIYARPGYGSAAVEAMLAECGVRYEVIPVMRDEKNNLPESFRTVNPMGQVPALVLPDGTVMTESAAMMIYLADRFPERRLAPSPDGAARPRYLRWMLFLAAALYPTDLLFYYPQRYSTDPGHAEAIKAMAGATMEFQYGILSDALGTGPFMLGNDFSALDIYAAMLISWAPDLAGLFNRHANLKVLYDRVAARPAIAPVWAANGL
jgi:glutathione S-transferase